MGGVIKVGIADLKVANSGSTLLTIGLGSCIGICLYDPVAKIGGLSHIMLPDSSVKGLGQSKPMKYANTAIPMLVNEMIEAGAFKRRFVTKIAGGATMFSAFGVGKTANVGERNIDAVKDALSALKLDIAAEDVGKNFGRTVSLSTVTGSITVKTAEQGTYEL